MGRWHPRWRGRARLANSLHTAKRLLIGSPRATRQLRATELPKLLALPVFSADPLSSVAYATEQAMIVLFAVSISGRDLILPLSGAVAALLAIVVLSYRQTVRAYTTSGGAYAVAKDNLGTTAGLTAAAALLIDYVLTVAVSISAGVTAITSAYASLSSLAVPMAVGFVALLTVVNLRGVRETGLAFAAPTYAFVAVVLLTIVAGLVQCTGHCPHAAVPHPRSIGPAGATIGIFVLLHAFASGSTALTGIEAISNGVGAFRRPKGANAARTLGAMGVIAIVLFSGVSFLAVQVNAAPSASVSVLSEVARAIFPTGAIFPGALFYAVQLLTFAILILAANSAFQGFPRLASLLARDRFLPREFGDLGDRLVYSNGAIVLAASAVALVIAFSANVERLIQLYVVGVFCAFTLSQAGMVRYWRRTRGRELPGVPAGTRPSWRRALAINALGAGATGFVTAVVITTKFLHGAWVVVAAIPLIVVGLRRLHGRYRTIEAELRRGAVEPLDEPVHNMVVLYVPDVDPASHEALAYVRHLDQDAIHAIHVAGHGTARDVRAEWKRLGDPHELTVLETDGRDPVATVIDHVDALERPDGAHFVTVVIPELMRKPSLAQPLRHQPALELKLRLLTEPGVVVADVPVLAEPGAAPLAPERIDPQASAAFVIVSAVDDATVNAVNYARALHSFPTRALFFALHPEATEGIQEAWERRNLPISLEVVECPFRELANPLLDTLTPITRQKNAIAAVILPEPILGGPVRSIVQNRTALYLRWLLVFEPHVVLSSVPYRIR
ncbi:MAG: APC family permease [Actinobacteria bacterium]|nr:MAG: APC family permease [Actinomycetota bacterium]